MKAILRKSFFRLLSLSLDEKGMELLDAEPIKDGYILTIGMPDFSEKKISMKRTECIRELIANI